MPGMVSQLHLQADQPETMWGISAQFSGDGFSDMQFDVSSLATADLGAWIDRIRSGGQNLDRDSYTALTHQSQRVEQATYRIEDPGLFDDIVRQMIPPGPGPQPEAPDHAGREVSTGGKD